MIFKKKYYICTIQYISVDDNRQPTYSILLFRAARRFFGVDNEMFGVDNETFGVDNETFGVDNETFGVDNGMFGVDNGMFGVDKKRNLKSFK
ncbi:MAG: hypothetical protein LBU62_01650 [Bacteroidales bacterium]|nr:hypothetical protein [Bacteroidales bacterium]